MRRAFSRSCTSVGSNPGALLTLVAALAGKHVRLHLSPREERGHCEVSGSFPPWCAWLGGLFTLPCSAYPSGRLKSASCSTQNGLFWSPAAVPEVLVLVSASDLSRGQLECSCENCWQNQRLGRFFFNTGVCVLHAREHNSLLFHGFTQQVEMREVRVQGHQVEYGLVPGRRGAHCIS